MPGPGFEATNAELGTTLELAKRVQDAQKFDLIDRIISEEVTEEDTLLPSDIEYELIEPEELDMGMFELAPAGAPTGAPPAAAAGAPARECSPEKITAKKSESDLAKKIFDILKKVSETQSEVITEQEERHLEAMTDRVGCSNLCDIMAGIGIDHANIKNIKNEKNRKTLQGLLEELDKLRVSSGLPKLKRIGAKRGKKKSSLECARKSKIQAKIKILEDINKNPEKKKTAGGVTHRKKAINQLQEDITRKIIKPTNADLIKFNQYVETFNTYIREFNEKDGAKGGGKRARRARSTKRTKGKSRGRARKATRVRRNNNNNSNKTKRNKGKKRRTKRA